MSYLSIVIPVYKAEECLDELHRRLSIACASITSDYKIILVEDCGPDLSWNKIQNIASIDPHVVGIKLGKNFGQHRAITAGLDHAQSEWVVVMDCDLEDRPEDIVLLYKHTQIGHKVVRALRVDRQHSIFKRTISDIFYKVFRILSGLNYDGRSANFRIMHKTAVDRLKQYREGLRFFGALCHIAGCDGVGVEVQHGQRHAGKSSYSIKTLLKLALETIIAYSNRPLYIMVYIGIFISILSLSFASFIFYRALFDKYVVHGWASVVILLSFSLGLILSSMGVLGLYIAKIFDEVKKRPLYFVEEIVTK